MKKIVSILLIFVAALGNFACEKAPQNPMFAEYHQYSKEVFGSGITFYAALRGNKCDKAYKEMLAVMQEINSEMSLTLSSSALSAFNLSKKTNEKFEISEKTYEILVAAQEISRLTDGAFDISLEPLSKLWRVDAESLARFGGVFPNEPAPAPPQVDEVARVKSFCDMGALVVEKGEKCYISKTNENLELDLGAIAKGYGADECVKIAAKYGLESCFINISGNICVYGEWYRGGGFTPWELSVSSPRPRGGAAGAMCALKIPKDKTLVTSGDYNRFYEYYDSGKSLYVPHIIDPKSGLPIGVKVGENGYYNDKNVISATVIADNSCLADALATALCVMGYDKAVEFLQKNHIAGIVVTEEKFALVGVGQKPDAGICLTQTEKYNGYKSYSVEEYGFTN